MPLAVTKKGNDAQTNYEVHREGSVCDFSSGDKMKDSYRGLRCRRIGGRVFEKSVRAAKLGGMDEP